MWFSDLYAEVEHFLSSPFLVQHYLCWLNSFKSLHSDSICGYSVLSCFWKTDFSFPHVPNSLVAVMQHSEMVLPPASFITLSSTTDQKFSFFFQFKSFNLFSLTLCFFPSSWIWGQKCWPLLTPVSLSCFYDLFKRLQCMYGWFHCVPFLFEYLCEKSAFLPLFLLSFISTT